jgi:queuine tRNA-ribosyltransferase
VSSLPDRLDVLLGAILLTTVNLAYYQNVMTGMRAAIARRRLECFRLEIKEMWSRGDVSPV